MKYILSALLLLFSHALFSYPSQDIKHEWNGWISKDGKPLEDTEFRKADKGFGSFLVISNDRGFFDRWNTPSDGFEINTLKKINKGEYFIVTVIFINPGYSESGNTHITYDIKITNPDGTTYADEKDVNVWNREAPKKNILGLAEGYLTIKMEPEDQLGKYKVEVVVKDLIKNAMLNLTRNYEVQK